jgi:methionine synthase II (cobalamin-independent)
MKQIKVFILLMLIANITYSQTKKEYLDADQLRVVNESDSIYKSNIKKTKLYGVYIPKDLDDAMTELDRLSPPESKVKLKTIDEDKMAKRLHFGLGKWIDHNWNLKEGSRYSHYLKELGLKNSDDMVNFTLISFHRFLMKQPQEIETRIKKYVKVKPPIKKN